MGKALGKRNRPERELGRLTGEIEQLQGEKRYYDHRIATSTIWITLDEGPGALSSVFAPVGEALSRSFSVFGASVGALLYFTTVRLEVE